ncbi:Forkhead box protein N3 [Galemys pyrenaicus]|uniref:Forkhead box protein N3 n=1 Tax=Galemys pyrenaicus TaxID=202257 RepID=A0A8J6E689_GALPY|nr:Forkhead box protein N3 [Galemys pyrenaicus]
MLFIQLYAPLFALIPVSFTSQASQTQASREHCFVLNNAPLQMPPTCGYHVDEGVDMKSTHYPELGQCLQRLGLGNILATLGIKSIGKGSLWCIDPEYRQNLIQALKKTPYHPYSHVFNTPPASPQAYQRSPQRAQLVSWSLRIACLFGQAEGSELWAMPARPRVTCTQARPAVGRTQHLTCEQAGWDKNGAPQISQQGLGQCGEALEVPSQLPRAAPSNQAKSKLQSLFSPHFPNSETSAPALILASVHTLLLPRGQDPAPPPVGSCPTKATSSLCASVLVYEGESSTVPLGVVRECTIFAEACLRSRPGCPHVCLPEESGRVGSSVLPLVSDAAVPVVTVLSRVP